MLHAIEVRNVHEALPVGLSTLLVRGILEPNRNQATLGRALVHPGPVVTTYLQPQERVLFWPQRDANPFLHLLESIWMLAGRNDLAFMERMSKQFKEFSDDGQTLHGAYGHRWRHHFGVDQLLAVTNMLKKDPTTRRAVLTMFDPIVDLGVGSTKAGKDIPCNTQIFFTVREQRLDMMVCCRSNDIVWGAYGANAVHMSVLQEWMASAIGASVGLYHQTSWNYHAYEKTLEPVRELGDLSLGYLAQANPYAGPVVTVMPLVGAGEDPVHFLEDCAMLIDEPSAVGFRSRFIRQIAKPMLMAHVAFKEHEGQERFLAAEEILAQMPKGNDWREASVQWLQRRYTAWQARQAA